jgi:hypothetical protein
VPAPSARSINAALPAELDRICTRAIAQDPRQRYASARALADDLDHWLMCHKGAKLRLSFTLSTILMGLAAALLLAIGIRAALLPWNEGVRGGGSEKLISQAPRGAVTDPSREAAVSAQQTSVPAIVPAAAKEKGELIGNLRKRVYHLSNCPDVRLMSASNRMPLKDMAEAAAKDLRPCDHCHPPTSAAAAKEAQSG